LGRAGLALLGGKYYEPAREALQAAAAGPEPPAGVRLGLAVAAFHLAGAKAGLEAIDHVPQAEQSGDFYLNRAEMLEAAGRLAEAGPSVDTGLKQAGDRLDLYRQALHLAVKWKRSQDAVRWTELGARALPDNVDALLLQASALEFAGRSADAARVFSGVENRWPEASAAWMDQGIALAARGHCEEARPKLDAAVALGARNAATYYYMADCAIEAKPPVKAAAEAAIQQAIAAAPDDPWVQSLGGRIAAENGDSKLAAARLQAATRLRPALAKQGAAREAPPYLMRLFEGTLVER
jgi:predicted Zn-dependent protease